MFLLRKNRWLGWALTEYSDLTVMQRANRMLLQTVMEKHGFKPYPKEWWHFTLKQEPYPNTYFNFNVE